MAPVRVDFQTRRDRLLDSIDKLQRLRDSMDSEEFAKDWRNVDAASNRLIAIGECMAPGTPHATPGTARIFHDARNRLAHETSRSPLVKCGISWSRSTTCKRKLKPAETSRTSKEPNERGSMTGAVGTCDNASADGGR